MVEARASLAVKTRGRRPRAGSSHKAWQAPTGRLVSMHRAPPRRAVAAAAAAAACGICGRRCRHPRRVCMCQPVQEELVGDKGDGRGGCGLEDGRQRALEQPRRALFGRDVTHHLPQAAHRVRRHALQGAKGGSAARMRLSAGGASARLPRLPAAQRRPSRQDEAPTTGPACPPFQTSGRWQFPRQWALPPGSVAGDPRTPPHSFQLRAPFPA